jgi:hypothetical protein
LDTLLFTGDAIICKVGGDLVRAGMPMIDGYIIMNSLEPW